MGNTSVNKVLPAVDMLLVLVVVIFATAGLLRSVPPGGADRKAYEALLAEQDRLNREIKSKKVEADKLGGDLQDLDGQNTLSPDALKTLLHAANGKQERTAEAQLIVADIRDKLNGVKEVLQEKHKAVTLENEIKILKEKIEQLEQERDTLKDDVAGIDLERANIQVLQNKIDDLNREIEQLKKEIEELEKPDATPLEEPSPFGGGYKGPFVPLECDDKGVIVYPDKKRVQLKASDDEIEWLKQQIRKKGAAALFVRPSGFEKSYAKFYEVLTVFADTENAKGKTIILSFWPIEVEEAIEKYTRKEY